MKRSLTLLALVLALLLLAAPAMAESYPPDDGGELPTDEVVDPDDGGEDDGERPRDETVVAAAGGSQGPALARTGVETGAALAVAAALLLVGGTAVYASRRRGSTG